MEVTDKRISEIEINSVPKNTKDLCKNTKTNIRLRLGDYEYLSFIDPERGGFGVIFPEVMIFSEGLFPEENIITEGNIGALCFHTISRAIPRAEGP